MFINQRIIGSDDTVFQTQILPYHNVIDWVVYRYQNWSGRIFSEAFVYIFSAAPLYFWQIVSTCVYALFVGVFFAYYKLFSKKQTHSKDYIFLSLALCLPFLADKSVLSEAGIWVTGSMVYLWTSAIGLIAFYPVAYYVTKHQKPHWLVTCLGVIGAVVAASSQEQVGAVLLGLSLAFLVYNLIVSWKDYRKIPWYLIFFCTIIGASLMISLLAPGNAIRLQSELHTWLPDFYTIPIMQRVEYSYRWLLEAFINHSGYLLIASWISMAALFAAKETKKRIDYVFIFLLVLACIFALSKGVAATSYWVDFYATWKPTIVTSFLSINLIPWAIILTSTVAAPLVLFRKQPIGYLLSVLFLASIASAAILLLSPTLYASLWRSFFVPSVLLMITVYILLIKVFGKYWRYRYVILGVILSLALSHYLFQVVRLLNNFH